MEQRKEDLESIALNKIPSGRALISVAKWVGMCPLCSYINNKTKSENIMNLIIHCPWFQIMITEQIFFLI